MKCPPDPDDSVTEAAPSMLWVALNPVIVTLVPPRFVIIMSLPAGPVVPSGSVVVTTLAALTVTAVLAIVRLVLAVAATNPGRKPPVWNAPVPVLPFVTLMILVVTLVIPTYGEPPFAFDPSFHSSEYELPRLTPVLSSRMTPEAWYAVVNGRVTIVAVVSVAVVIVPVVIVPVVLNNDPIVPVVIDPVVLASVLIVPLVAVIPESVITPVVVCAPVSVPLPNVSVKIDAEPLVPEVNAEPVNVSEPFVPLIERPVPLIVSEFTNACVLRTAVPRSVSVVARVPIVVPSISTIVVVSVTAAVPVMLGHDRIRRVPETCEYAGSHNSKAATTNRKMRFMVCLLNK